MHRLLKTYEETDRVVQQDLDEDEREVACHKGCSTCCESIGFPIFEPEVDSIAKHVHELADAQLKERILTQMEEYDGKGTCPFLVDTECGVYAVRPLSCRTYFMHGEPCTPEDLQSDDRVDDMHRIDKAKLFEASVPLLDMYDIPAEHHQIAYFGGFIQDRSAPMSIADWNGIAEIIRERSNP